MEVFSVTGNRKPNTALNSRNLFTYPVVVFYLEAVFPSSTGLGISESPRR